MPEMALIQTIICTLDEAMHIERAVASALPLGSVIVVDSNSTDATRELAEASGADVFVHEWAGYAAQKNWALQAFGERATWTLLLDADEYVPNSLATEILEVASSGNHSDVAALMVPRRYVFLGRELRHAWWFPDYQIRFVRPERCRFEDRSVHEHPVVSGKVYRLDNALMHENLKGLHAFLDRHNRYSSLEAQEIARREQRKARGSDSSLPPWTSRRRFIKERIWQRLPARGLLRFVWLYVVRRGFLDGRQGLIFSCLVAFYEAEIQFKVYEQELAAPGHGG